MFDASAVTLSNDAMDIHFSASGTGFAVTSVVNRLAGGVRFVWNDRKVPDFWEVCLVTNGGAYPRKELRLQNHTPSRERTVERIEDGYAFVWKGLSIPGGERECVDVRAEVRLPGDSTASEWRLSVTNRSRAWTLSETRYPCLRSIVKDGEADVLMPHSNLGARLHRSYSTATGETCVVGYPGWRPMVAAYMKDGAGLHIAAHDPGCRNKSMVFGRGADVEFRTPVENAGVPGQAAEGPRYPVEVAVFAGDWWQSARLYREWALRQKWCARGRLDSRADFPKMMADIDLWLIGSGEPLALSNLLVKVRKSLPEVGLGVHWYRWNVQPFDTHYPEYLPRAGVRETVAWMSAIGIAAMPYTNGRLWDMALASTPYAMGDACAAPDGSVRVELYNNGRRFAVMCPFAPGWQQVLRYGITNTVALCGAPSLYCDQVACSRPQLCFNLAHGHPLGGGSWWADGYRDALEPVHEALSDQGIALTSEGAAECWMDVIDGHLVWTTPRPDDVPFYPAVYSGYTVYFGSPSHIKDSLDSFFAIQARALLWGVAPGWNGAWTFSKGREDWAALHLAIARVRQSMRDFLVYGTLKDELRPLDQPQKVAFEWSPRRRASGEPETFRTEFPAVLGAVWTDTTGVRTAVLAANVSRERQTVRFRLPEGVKTLVPMDLHGQPRTPTVTVGDIAEITIDAKGIVAIEMR